MHKDTQILWMGNTRARLLLSQVFSSTLVLSTAKQKNKKKRQKQVLKGPSHPTVLHQRTEIADVAAYKQRLTGA